MDNDFKENPNQTNLHVVNTENVLTVEELKELKHLASISKTSKVILGVIFAFLSLFGIPQIIDWIIKHLH